jgi:hypothetical protein
MRQSRPDVLADVWPFCLCDDWSMSILGEVELDWFG